MLKPIGQRKRTKRAVTDCMHCGNKIFRYEGTTTWFRYVAAKDLTYDQSANQGYSKCSRSADGTHQPHPAALSAIDA